RASRPLKTADFIVHAAGGPPTDTRYLPGKTPGTENRPAVSAVAGTCENGAVESGPTGMSDTRTRDRSNVCPPDASVLTTPDTDIAFCSGTARSGRFRRSTTMSLMAQNCGAPIVEVLFAEESGVGPSMVRAKTGAATANSV